MTVDKRLSFRGFSSPAEQARILAGDIAFRLQAGIDQRGSASLVVSGGSTPLLLFGALAGQEISWDRVIVTLADERWVTPTDQDSNEGLVRRHLLTGRAANARFIGLWSGEASAGAAEAACEKAIAAIPLPFDVVVLGMGRDGHIASIFPGAPELPTAISMESGRRCAAITPPKAAHGRMTLTLAVLIQARGIYLLLTGKEKLHTFEQAIGAGEPMEMPVRALLAHARQPVLVCWAP
ncbi:MAG: 6-phosphogluconolactonase [Thermodesulfobacteriota bacterium]